MQEDMRFAFPATVPAEVQVDRVHIHVLPHRGSPVEQTASMACHYTPGHPVRLYLEDIKDCIEGWTPKAEARPGDDGVRWGLIRKGDKIWIMHDGEPVSVVLESMIESRPATRGCSGLAAELRYLAGDDQRSQALPV